MTDRELQLKLNQFTEKWLTNYPRLKVDGDRGPATNRRIQTVKYYIGYTGQPQRRSSLTPEFLKRMAHPKGATVPNPMKKVGEKRRREQRERAEHPPVLPGVVLFDGRPCAKWMVPYLEWARKHGWDGTLVSGYRTPEFSESLCQRMCGAPSCPGRCAGRSSNHSGNEKPRGAVDVSDFAEFGRLMARAPFDPKIHNALGAQDPVHFSVSGR